MRCIVRPLYALPAKAVLRPVCRLLGRVLKRLLPQGPYAASVRKEDEAHVELIEEALRLEDEKLLDQPPGLNDEEPLELEDEELLVEPPGLEDYEVLEEIPEGELEELPTLTYNDTGMLVKSIDDSVHLLSVEFTNNSGTPVAIFWLDYNGKPMGNLRYSTPGCTSSLRMKSFSGQPWTVRAWVEHEKDKFLMFRESGHRVSFPSAKCQSLTIERAASIPWSAPADELHFRAERAFRAELMTVLLAHRRLAKRSILEAADPVEPSSNLGSLHTSLIELILSHVAPPVPVVQPILEKDLLGSMGA